MTANMLRTGGAGAPGPSWRPCRGGRRGGGSLAGSARLPGAVHRRAHAPRAGHDQEGAWRVRLRRTLHRVRSGRRLHSQGRSAIGQDGVELPRSGVRTWAQIRLPKRFEVRSASVEYSVEWARPALRAPAQVEPAPGPRRRIRRTRRRSAQRTDRSLAPSSFRTPSSRTKLARSPWQARFLRGAPGAIRHRVCPRSEATPGSGCHQEPAPPEGLRGACSRRCASRCRGRAQCSPNLIVKNGSEIRSRISGGSQHPCRRNPAAAEPPGAGDPAVAGSPARLHNRDGAVSAR